MKIEFKNDCVESDDNKNWAQELANTCEDFISKNCGMNLHRTSIRKRIITDKSKVKLTFPPFNKEWTRSISSLVLLICSSENYYISVNNDYFEIRGEKEKNYKDLVSFIKNNMNVEVLICK